MRKTAGFAAAGAFAVAAVLSTPTAALAAGGSSCDAYSQTCPSVEPTHFHKVPTKVEAVHLSRLPFTGAEIAGMSIAGVAAIGGGGALVIAGRRRRRAAA